MTSRAIHTLILYVLLAATDGLPIRAAAVAVCLAAKSSACIGIIMLRGAICCQSLDHANLFRHSSSMHVGLRMHHIDRTVASSGAGCDALQ